MIDKMMKNQPGNLDEMGRQVRDLMVEVCNHVQGKVKSSDMNTAVRELARLICNRFRDHIRYERQNDASEALLWVLDLLNLDETEIYPTFHQTTYIDAVPINEVPITAMSFPLNLSIQGTLPTLGDLINGPSDNPTFQRDPDDPTGLSGWTVKSKRGQLHVYGIKRFNNDSQKIMNRIQIPTTMEHSFGKVLEAPRTLRLKTVLVHLGRTIQSGHYVTYKWDHERQGYWYFTDGNDKPRLWTEAQAQSALQENSYVVIYEDITEDS